MFKHGLHWFALGALLSIVVSHILRRKKALLWSSGVVRSCSKTHMALGQNQALVDLPGRPSYIVRASGLNV